MQTYTGLKLLACCILILVFTGCAEDPDKYGDKLLYSVLMGDMDQTKELIESGVNINYQNAPLRNGVLHACTANSRENTQMLTYLIQNGADVNMQNVEGSTPLKFAIVTQQVESIKILLKHGADINITDRSGFRIRDYLDPEEDKEIMELFSAAGRGT